MRSPRDSAPPLARSAAGVVAAFDLLRGRVSRYGARDSRPGRRRRLTAWCEARGDPPPRAESNRFARASRGTGPARRDTRVRVPRWVYPGCGRHRSGRQDHGRGRTAIPGAPSGRGRHRVRRRRGTGARHEGRKKKAAHRAASTTRDSRLTTLTRSSRYSHPRIASRSPPLAAAFSSRDLSVQPPAHSWAADPRRARRAPWGTRAAACPPASWRAAGWSGRAPGGRTR